MSDEREQRAEGLPPEDREEANDRQQAEVERRMPMPYRALGPNTSAYASPDDLEHAEAIEETLDVEGTADEIAKTSRGGAEAIVGRWGSPVGRVARTVLAFVVFFGIVFLTWELFKWLFGDPWRFEDVLGTGWDYFHQPPFYLIQASDLQLPHVWDIVYALSEPVQRNQDESLFVYLVGAAFSTWRQAVIGFAIGAFIGVALASIFVHSLLTERAFMPYVIASQAIPIVALAPIIAAAAGRGATAVVIIAVYLTFFPVTVAQSRGLRSPDPRSLELMRSFAASKWDIYRKVRLPASVPYLFTALKVAAAAAIVGAIIGEGPGGVKDGLGRAIINFNQQYISGPEKLWATILIAALTGILFFVMVRIAEVVSTRQRTTRPPAATEPVASSPPAQGAL
ncbi:MAG: ABC transporter permease subunit [Chloroflexota bacterium]|jgi:NitT/TauT family transport system permease protein